MSLFLKLADALNIMFKKYLPSFPFVLRRKIFLAKNKYKQKQNSNLPLQEVRSLFQMLNSKIVYFYDFTLKGWIIVS